jgi:hypothetical protein
LVRPFLRASQRNLITPKIHLDDKDVTANASAVAPHWRRTAMQDNQGGIADTQSLQKPIRVRTVNLIRIKFPTNAVNYSSVFEPPTGEGP